MNDKEKKATLKILIIFGVAISIAISITWLVLILEFAEDIKQQMKEIVSWLFANFGSMTLGLILKILVNNKHKKEITEIVEGGAMFGKKQKEPIKFSNDFEVVIKDIKIVKKKGKLTFESIGDIKDFESDVAYAMGELVSLHLKN